MLSPLEQLNGIQVYGRPVYHGSNLQVKYRKKSSNELDKKLIKLKNRYPELLIHKADTGYTLFGGTFSKQSNILYEVKILTA